MVILLQHPLSFLGWNIAASNIPIFSHILAAVFQSRGCCILENMVILLLPAVFHPRGSCLLGLTEGSQYKQLLAAAWYIVGSIWTRASFHPCLPEAAIRETQGAGDSCPPPRWHEVKFLLGDSQLEGAALISPCPKGCHSPHGCSSRASCCWREGMGVGMP